ncbi:MAG TPA: DUF4406 domain-containing protein [Flavobacterium sp.]|nr:DUF4406 domain-containing protein [Flavobacterium sp.]
MRIYISGKITGKEPELVEKAFNWTEEQLLKQGYEVVNPLKLPHNHDGSWINYIREDMPHMINCDAIVMIDDWKTSNGAQLELDVAQRLGLKVYYQTKPQSAYFAPGIMTSIMSELPTGIEDEVFIMVCRLFKKSVKDAKENMNRNIREYVMIRQVSMTILHLKHGIKLTPLAKYFGGKDHATAIHSIKTVSNLLKTDFDFRRDYGYLFDGLIFPNYK